jgi:hypothetical protein
MKRRTRKTVDLSDSVRRPLDGHALAAIPGKSIIVGQTCRS